MDPTLKEGQMVENKEKMTVCALYNSAQNFFISMSSETEYISKC